MLELNSRQGAISVEAEKRCDIKLFIIPHGRQWRCCSVAFLSFALKTSVYLLIIIPGFKCKVSLLWSPSSPAALPNVAVRYAFCRPNIICQKIQRKYLSSNFLFAYSSGHIPGSDLDFVSFPSIKIFCWAMSSSQHFLSLFLLEKNWRCKSLKWHHWLPQSCNVAGTLTMIHLWICSRSPNMKERRSSLNYIEKVLLWILNTIWSPPTVLDDQYCLSFFYPAFQLTLSHSDAQEK